MKLLNKTSLAQTIDNVNEAFFYGMKISKKDAGDVISWISSQQGTAYSYAGSFGVTAKDMKGKVYTFTGEQLTSPASMRHIIAEEASRVLIQLSKLTGKKVPALKTANVRLLRGIKYGESIGKPAGTFCCGACTIGLWRHINSGGFPAIAKKLPLGIQYLKTFRDGKGSWGRFPFYYTLLALSEMKSQEAKREIMYVMPVIKSRLNRMKKSGKFSQRRYDLLLKLLNQS
jgi:hypothetical protein